MRGRAKSAAVRVLCVLRRAPRLRGRLHGRNCARGSEQRCWAAVFASTWELKIRSRIESGPEKQLLQVGWVRRAGSVCYGDSRVQWPAPTNKIHPRSVKAGGREEGAWAIDAAYAKYGQAFSVEQLCRQTNLLNPLTPLTLNLPSERQLM